MRINKHALYALILESTHNYGENRFYFIFSTLITANCRRFVVITNAADPVIRRSVIDTSCRDRRRSLPVVLCCFA